ncbi:hypothetical protein CCAX7_25530 [Capsulimonas corticalis]|uniref:Uncharacterized protein n=1 Tax=Capsulimonas corticalis TaxID=2219043 RepID=A0A402CVN3_9BACT|nr:AraC family transcriptional regulator [Capsulimonas corticalis]BDI30502.1 hypothetical protein CCAX7_25530 [Capsulimonas corticalis]
MAYDRPAGLLAGFHASLPDPETPELLHVGEQWAPRDFFITPHTHHVWEFYVQAAGECRWQSGDRVYTLSPGGLFAVAPEILHTMHDKPARRHHFYYAAIDLTRVFARLPALEEVWSARSIVFTPRAESMTASFQQLIREVSVDLPYRTPGIQRALDTLVVEATRVARGAPTAGSLSSLHPAVWRAKELLDYRCQEPWKLHDLARMCGLSANYLVERFTADIGMPPRRYLLQVRIHQAREMLTRTDLPISDIGLELGFGSSQHFTVAFTKATGEAPLKYRQARRLLPE